MHCQERQRTRSRLALNPHCQAALADPRAAVRAALLAVACGTALAIQRLPGAEISAIRRNIFAFWVRVR
jgi:hypothetical protein